MTTPGFYWTARVYYEDTDAGGVVFYANYLRFLERARTEWLRAIGFNQHALADAHELAFAVKKVEIDYHAPARLDDELKLSVAVERVGRASVQFLQEISRADAGGETLLAEARVTVVCVALPEFRPRAIPDDILEKIRPRA